MVWFQIILRETFTDFPNGDTNNGICSGLVVRFSGEKLNAECPLFDLVNFSS